MRKKGFTLLETLLAVAILVVLLGASVTANRIVSDNTISTEEMSQMNALVDSSLASVNLFQESLTAGTDFGPQLNATTLAANQVQPTSVTGSFISVPLTGQTCTYGANCRYTDQSGPAKLQWCDSSNVSTGACDALIVPAAPNPAGCSPSATCRLSYVFTYLAGKSLPNGDIVAIRKTPYSAPVGGAPDVYINRSIASVDTRRATENTYLNATGDDDNQNWNFYLRSIKITRYPKANGATLFSNTLDSTAADALSNSTYRVTVTLQNLRTLQTVLTKSISFSDWRF